MKATILCVGTELLFGQTVNTNATYLSQQLQLLGIDVLYHFTVGDNPDRLRALLETALEETDLVITSGGLGPTQDDLTKEIITEVMGDELVLNQEVYDTIAGFFKSVNREMTENNKKQAYVPKNGTVIFNDKGTAPGIICENENKIVIALPGPPRELKYLFEKTVLPFLAEKTHGGMIYYKILRFYGIGESTLESELLPLIDGQTDPTIATYAKEGECTIRIASKRSTEEEAIQAVNDMQQKVKAIVGDFMFSDTDQDLSTVVASKLIEKELTLSCAESATGGLFASELINFPGISDSFDSGFITYSNAAKVEELGVSADTIKKYGAVSEEVAVEMAKGCRERAQTTIAVSVTGVAGPEGGTDDKPIGLAWICVTSTEGTRTKRFFFNDRGRNWNRRAFMLEMFNQVNRLINEKY